MVMKGEPISDNGTAPSSAGSPEIAAVDRSQTGGRAGMILQNEDATYSIRYGGPDITASKGVLLGPGEKSGIVIQDGPLYVICTTANTPTWGLTEWLQS